MPRSIATLPLDGMLVYRKVTPQEYVAGTYLYTWVKSCLLYTSDAADE